MQTPHLRGELSSQGLCAAASAAAALPASIPRTSRNLGCISTPRDSIPEKMVLPAPAQVATHEIPLNRKAGRAAELCLHLAATLPFKQHVSDSLNKQTKKHFVSTLSTLWGRPSGSLALLVSVFIMNSPLHSSGSYWFLLLVLNSTEWLSQPELIAASELSPCLHPTPTLPPTPPHPVLSSLQKQQPFAMYSEGDGGYV